MSRSKKRAHSVCLISTYPPTECGIAVYTRNLVRHLEMLRPGLRIYVLADDGNSRRTEGNAHIVPSWNRFRLTPSTSLIANFLAARPSTLHIQYVPTYALFASPFGALQLLMILILCRLMRKPSIMTLHEILAKTGTRFTARLPMIALSVLSSRLVVHGQSMACELRHYPIHVDKISVIHQPAPRVRSDMSKLEARKLLMLDEHSNLLLVLGFISRRKGIEVAIRAMPTILASFPETSLLIAGSVHPLDQESHRYMREMIALSRELRLSDRVLFRQSFLSHSGQEPLYLVAADVVLFPFLPGKSSYSSSSLSLAFAYAKAIGASRLPQFVEEDEGKQRLLFFEPNDIDSLAEAILKILSSTDLRERLETNSQAYAKDISWYKAAKFILTLYDSDPDSREQVVLDT